MRGAFINYPVSFPLLQLSSSRGRLVLHLFPGPEGSVLWSACAAKPCVFFSESRVPLVRDGGHTQTEMIFMVPARDRSFAPFASSGCFCPEHDLTRKGNLNDVRLHYQNRRRNTNLSCPKRSEPYDITAILPPDDLGLLSSLSIANTSIHRAIHHLQQHVHCNGIASS